MAKVGRPRTISAEITEKVAEALRVGHYITTAAALAGVRSATIHDWVRRGVREAERREQGKEPDGNEEAYVEFSYTIEKALAEFTDERLKRIGGNKSWQSDAWALERRRPDEFGQRGKVNVGLNDGEASDYSDALREVLDRLPHRRGEQDPRESAEEGDAG